ncbi:MAG TPA: hypothetical protein VNP04_27575 [Alphaproteobacteria bacterium]|nr:hypothetical protein [Alphaproteobacteria bacterium]
MAGITLTQAQAELDRWRGVYAKLTDVAAHNVQGGGARQITKITPDECLRQIEHWERKVTELSRKTRHPNHTWCSSASIRSLPLTFPDG